MPIEFACESCARLLRVPDGSQGSQCECPACKSILEIPDPAAVGMIEVHNASDDLRLDFQVPCPKCQKPLRCPPSLIGTKGQCRSCQYIFLISDDPESEIADAPNLVFSCPKCQQLFEGSEEMRGRKGKCHVCGEVFAIELKPAEVTPQDSTPQDSLLANTDAEQAPAPNAVSQNTLSNPLSSSQPSNSASAKTPQPTNIQFSCSSCDGVMEVPASTVGQKTACPYCSTHLVIPAASPTPTAQSPSNPLDNPASNSQPLDPTPTQEQEDDYRLAALDSADFNQPLSDPYGGNRYSSGTKTPATAQTEFGDINPYDAPSSDYAVPSGNWDAKRRPKKKKLTFSNVFSLTFEMAFPSSLLTSLVYILGFGLAGGVLFGGIFVTVLVLAQLGVLDPVVNGILLVVAGLVLAIIAMFIGNFTFCMMYRSALLAIRDDQPSLNDLFNVRDAAGRMLLYFFLVSVLGIFSAAPSLISLVLGPENAMIGVFVGIPVSLITGLFGMAISFAPFGIVDGRSTGDAIATSFHIFKNHALTVLGSLIVASLMCSAAASLTCGIGMILLVGFPFYVLAAIYELAPKDR